VGTCLVRAEAGYSGLGLPEVRDTNYPALVT